MRHHYVPQFYLRHWAAEDGRLWRYRREPSGRVSERPVGTRSTAYEPDLYAVLDAGEIRAQYDPHVIETKFFGQVDNDGAPVLKKLSESEPPALDDAERTAWSLFMNSLIERGPTALAGRDAVAPAVAAQTLDKLFSMSGTTPEGRERLERIIARIDPVQMARNSVREFMVGEIRDPKVIGYLKSLAWVVIPREPGSHPFITTDAPLLVNAGEGSRPISILSMALSPKKLLFVYPSQWAMNDELRTLIGNLVYGHDLLLLRAGCTCAYSSQRIEDNARVGLRKAVYRALESDKPFLRDAEQE